VDPTVLSNILSNICLTVLMNKVIVLTNLARGNFNEAHCLLAYKNGSVCTLENRKSLGGDGRTRRDPLRGAPEATGE
jgi:hypothetical protein